MNRSIIGAALLLATGTVASADDTFVVVRGDQMYRYSNGNVVQTTMTDTFHSLSSTKLGIIGVSNLQENVGNPPPDFEVWRVDDVTNTPSLTRIGTFTDIRFPTITQVGNTMWGIGEGMIYTIGNDLSLNHVSTLAGGESIGGSAYDAISDTFYVSSQTTDRAFSLDLVTGVLTEVGSLGIDVRNQGGEWWRGQYWAAFEDVTNDRLVLGTIDTTSGLFTMEVVLQQGLGDLVSNQTVGLAIIPSPSGIALLSLGALAAVRRRR
jgi:hypothetical protein